MSTSEEKEEEVISITNHGMGYRYRSRRGIDVGDEYGNAGRNLIRGGEAEDEYADANYYLSPSSCGGPLTLASSIVVRGSHHARPDGFCLFWDDNR